MLKNINRYDIESASTLTDFTFVNLIVHRFWRKIKNNGMKLLLTIQSAIIACVCVLKYYALIS